MHHPVRFLASAVAALALAACSKTADAPPPKTPGVDSGAPAFANGAAPGACPGNNAMLTLPAGFCATIFADSITHGRHVTVASNGDVYITLEAVPPDKQAASTSAAASFVALRDTNHDGIADLVQRIGSVGNTGIGLYKGYLYVDEGERIVRYARADSQLVPAATPEIIIDGIPMEAGHRARNFAIGTDGALYLNVGSATNSCQKRDRENGSPGNDPCTELNTRGGLWKYDANTTSQHFSASNRFATGIRNGMGIAFGPDGKLYATQHGRDQLHDNWPKIFPTTGYQAENPGEELMQVNQGDDFGWPYCYYSVEEKKLVDAPEYGGDGKKTARCAGKKAPVAVFPGHWAPMSLLFYTGSSFPDKYRNGAFIAFHGSWNRAPDPQAGYRVTFQPLSNGGSSGAAETFADGFAEQTGVQLQPTTAKHRPMGLAMAPDGALFITDDAGGRVYRVTFKK